MKNSRNLSRSQCTLTFVLLLLMAAVPFTSQAAPGDVDTLDPAIMGTYVLATAVQPDGKTIIAGRFTSVLGQPRQNIARLNADGTLDAGFDPKTNNEVNSVAVQADGKILLAGGFTTLQPNGTAGTTPRQYIARVNADGTLDAGFDPKASGSVNSVAVQADGKILLAGAFYSLQPNGSASATARQNIARVNADGTLDASFDPNPNTTVYCMAVQADGKILLGGNFTTLQPTGAASATSRQRIARVNEDGTLDAGFDPKANSTVYSVALQADGKILLGGFFTTLQPNGAASATPRQYIARVNADGTLDGGFDPTADTDVLSVALQADGKILLGGKFSTLKPNGASLTSRRLFARLLNNPATESLTAGDATQVLWTRGGSSPEVSQVTFELSTNGGTSYTSLPGGATRVGTTSNWQLASLSLPASGQLRARGRTTNGYHNGGSGLAESVTTYTLAPTVTAISPSTGRPLGGTSVTISGRSFTGATGVTIGGTAATSVTVVNDTTIICTTGAHAPGAASVLVSTPGGTNAVNTLYTYAVLPGELDPLNPAVVGSFLRATAVQPDGKTIIAGSFSTVLGQPRQNIARLNADGTLDSGFDPKPSGTVNSVAVQADGKILLGGHFTTLQPNGAASATARQYIARVNGDGTLDAGFYPKTSDFVYCVALQADGKILLGGYFTTLQPNGAASATVRQNIARVNADGTLDAAFDPQANSEVYSVVVQADGKILLGGGFTTLQPKGAASATPRQFIARVNADGTLDTGFNPKANNAVLSVALQADGRMLLGGVFTTLQPNGAAVATARQRIARVNMDGTLDAAFDPKASSYVDSLVVQADGKILLGGNFSTLQPNGAASATTRQYIARVNADGTLDAGFDPKANSVVYSVALQMDGKILLGGQFSTLQPNGAASATVRQFFAQLLNDPATQSLTAADTTLVLWTRGGSSPEVSQVSFELSTNGGTSYASLPGTATRVGASSNWQLASLNLPASGQLRARGRPNGGYQNGVSGLVESVASFTGLAVPAPTVTSISPASGSSAGGTSVTITGTNFTGATGVTIGGTAATSVTVVNDTTITCTTPAGAAGTVSVLVTTPGGTNTANTLYTYVFGSPMVDAGAAAIPDTNLGSYPFTVGTEFTIATPTSVTGLGFIDVGADGLVASHEVALWTNAGVMVAGPVTITGTDVAVPSAQAGSVWRVKALAAPVLLSPGTYRVAGLLDATYADKILTNVALTVPGVTRASGYVRTEVLTPALAYPDQTFGSIRTAATFFSVAVTSSPVPTVTSSTGNLLATATTMTITGTGFDSTPGNNTVVFNDGAVGTVTGASATQLTVTFSTKPVSAGSLTGIVTTPSGNSGTAVQVATVIPVVTFASASQTTAVTTVTINGLGFAVANANNSVLFNLGAAGSVTSSSPTQLVVTFAIRPTAGNLQAVVTSNTQSSGAAVQVATIVPPVVATTAAVDLPSGTTPGSTIAGTSWESIRSGMVMSGSGPLAYRGHMALSGGVTANDFQGIWKTPDGTAASSSLVVRSGVTVEPSVGALFDILPFNPIINNAAQVSFIGMLRVNSGSPAVTTSSDSGVWSELGTGGLMKLLREGDTLSGSTVGTVAPSTWIAGSANAAAFSVKLGSASALVRVDVAGAVATPSIVAKQGDIAPVKTGGDAGTFDALSGNTSDPRMDLAGNVAFLSTVLPAGQGIWYKAVAGALTAVANTNQAAPGLGGPVFTGFERPSLSSDGSTIAFRAFLSGANGQSVFKGAVAAPGAIAKSNDTAISGVPAGRKLWSIWSPFTNNTGKVAFRVSLVDTGTNANESRAILTDANGTLSVIAKVGDTAPGLGAQTFANFDHPIIGDGNQCAFIAGTSGGTVALFRQAAGGGALVLVTMVGDVVTLTGGGTDTIAQMVIPGTATDDRKYETKAIDTAGRILVHVTYTSGKTGIFLSAP